MGRIDPWLLASILLVKPQLAEGVPYPKPTPSEARRRRFKMEAYDRETLLCQILLLAKEILAELMVLWEMTSSILGG